MPTQAVAYRPSTMRTLRARATITALRARQPRRQTRSWSHRLSRAACFCGHSHTSSTTAAAGCPPWAHPARDRLNCFAMASAPDRRTRPAGELAERALRPAAISVPIPFNRCSKNAGEAGSAVAGLSKRVTKHHLHPRQTSRPPSRDGTTGRCADTKGSPSCRAAGRTNLLGSDATGASPRLQTLAETPPPS